MRTQVHMGTFIKVDVEDMTLSDAVFEEFALLDRLLSTYKIDSEISRLNRDNELIPSLVTREILEHSLRMYHLSEGAFDITIGSLTHNAYRFGYTNEHLPSSKEIEEQSRFIGSDGIKTVGNKIITIKGSVIDLGGIAKGYAVDRALRLLENKGVRKAVVAASGDIGCLGACEITIQDPFHSDGSIANVSSSLKRFSISTSGNYERYIKTKAHNHLINPKSHTSQQWFASVTLMDMGDNTRLDALATAVSVMDEHKAIEMLQKLNIKYLLIRNDGTMIKSDMPHGVTLHYTL
ncbi:MAG TPA: FAD:protein FMN transferase [Sulfuricurvum sp.]|nr:FAD:protein FMN transferase [Sulfuricurvum sp.]